MTLAEPLLIMAALFAAPIITGRFKRPSTSQDPAPAAWAIITIQNRPIGVGRSKHAEPQSIIV